MILLSLRGYSNAKLFPGYYINLKGDTVQCKLEFRDWNYNPKKIKVQVNNTLVEFGPGDIKGFGATGYSDYRSAEVSYHSNPISGNLPVRFSDSVETTACFLKIIVSGYYTLYRLDLSQRFYWFSSQANGAITELIYRVKEVSGGWEEDQNYQREIMAQFVSEGMDSKYYNRVNSALYTGKDIESLYILLDEHRSGIPAKKKSTGGVDLEIFGGAIRNSFPSSLDGDYSTGNHFSPSTTASGGVNLMYSIPGKFNAFKIGLSIGYNSYRGQVDKSDSIVDIITSDSYSTTHYQETIQFSNSLLLVGFYLSYTLNPLDKWKFYLKPGLTGNFSLKNEPAVIATDTTTVTEYRYGAVSGYTSRFYPHPVLYFYRTYLSFFVSAGVKTGRSSLEFTYCPPTTINFMSSNAFKTSSVAVFYYYTLFSSGK